jgi:hypothetical protein
LIKGMILALMWLAFQIQPRISISGECMVLLLDNLFVSRMVVHLDYTFYQKLNVWSSNWFPKVIRHVHYAWSAVHSVTTTHTSAGNSNWRLTTSLIIALKMVTGNLRFVSPLLFIYLFIYLSVCSCLSFSDCCCYLFLIFLLPMSVPYTVTLCLACRMVLYTIFVLL